MNLEQLITIVRFDYLDDDPESAPKKYLWDDEFMFRSFTEAERQACNRQNLLFDDTTAEYTQITLVSGKSTYDIPQKITKIEYVSFEDKEVDRQSKHELNRNNTDWRTETGMTDKPVQHMIRGHKIRFIPSPDADDAGEVVSLEIFRLPECDFLNLSSEPEIPEEYHRDLIYWVLHEAYKKQDADRFNQERSDYFLSRFTEIFGEYISAEVRLNQMQQRGSLHLRPTAYTSKLTRSTNADDWNDL